MAIEALEFHPGVLRIGAGLRDDVRLRSAANENDHQDAQQCKIENVSLHDHLLKLTCCYFRSHLDPASITGRDQPDARGLDARLRTIEEWLRINAHEKHQREQ